jgi:Zn-dependent protease with chaperone function
MADALDRAIWNMESQAFRSNMSDERFEELVNKAQAEFDANPSGYRQRVAMLAVLGYAYVALLISIFLAGAYFIVYEWWNGVFSINKLTLLIFFVLVVLGFTCVKALWVKMQAPEGITITQSDAPGLFAVINKLENAEQVRIDEVRIADNYNACVLQIPRLGLLGWYKNYLIIGLPLLYGNTVEQATATLAHEMGHISGSHGKLGAWIYSLQSTWQTLIQTLRQEGGASYFAFFPFFAWYMPKFNAYARVLTRQQEYEADRLANELSTKQANAESLVLFDLHLRHLGTSFWKHVADSVKTSKDPPEDLYVRLGQELQHVAMSEDTAQKWFQEALNAHTDIRDSHPSLIDRLVDIGYPSKNRDEIRNHQFNFKELLRIEKNAADELLGPLATELAWALSRKWAEKVKPVWMKRHEEAAKDRELFAQLQVKEGPLTKDDLLNLAYLTEQFSGVQQALPLYSRAVEEHPADADAAWLYGNALMKEEVEDAMVHIERAMHLSSRYVEMGCEAAKDFYTRRGEREKVDEFKKRLSNHSSELQLARDERREVVESDSFFAHDLDEEIVQGLGGWCGEFKHVKEVYLVQKKLKHMPDWKQYVLAVRTRNFGLNADEDNAAVQYAMQQGLAEYPVDVMPVVLDSIHKNIVNGITSVENSQIWTRTPAKK